MLKPTRKPLFRLTSTALLAGALLCATPAFAVNKDMIQLQTQIQQLQDAVARLLHQLQHARHVDAHQTAAPLLHLPADEDR